MEDFENLALEAKAVAPVVEKALARKFNTVALEEISIAVSEAIVSYLEAALRGTLDEEHKPAGYMWRVGTRTIHRYLLHRQREPTVGADEQEYDGNDNAAEYLDVKETLRVVLSFITSDNYREVLQLHWLEELSFEEISAKQLRSMKAIYNCHERALTRGANYCCTPGTLPPPPEYEKVVVRAKKVVDRKREESDEEKIRDKALI